MKKLIACVAALVLSLSAVVWAQNKEDLGVSKELQGRIEKSIERGIAWLKGQQQADGSFPLQNSDEFAGGSTALALHTLLKCSVSRDDDAIKKGFEWLKKSPLFEPVEGSKNYCVSILILALEAKYNSNEVVTKGTAVAAGAKMSPEDKEWIKRLHKYLINHRYEYEGEVTFVVKKGKETTTAGTEKLPCVAWGYPGGPPKVPLTKWWDNSNTQFALLALEACSRVGVNTPDDVWGGIINHFLNQQDKDGEKVKRVGVDTSKGTTVEVSEEDRARGWTYMPPGTGVTAPVPKTSYPSMSAIGVASLVICNSELQKNGKYKKLFMVTVEAAIRDGIAWLGKNFPVGDANYMGSGHYNYALYGLERVGTLAKIVNIGGHLWFKEGAEDIVKRQNGDGSWDNTNNSIGSGRLAETCFCLLFLRKATFKVPGGGYQIDTKG